MALFVEFLQNPLDIFALREEWDSLLDRTPKGPPFSSWSWIILWWQKLARGSLGVLTAREDGRLIGLLPLLIQKHPILPLRSYSLAAAGYREVSDQQDLLAEAGREAEIATRFARALAQDTRWDRLRLENLPAPGSLSSILARTLGGEQVIEAEKRPVIRFGSSFDEYLKSRPRDVLSQVWRKRRWFEKSPGFSWRVLTRPEEIEIGIETLFSLHERSFTRKGEVSQFLKSPRHRAFHREAAVELAKRGWARLYILEARGAPRAALYGFERAERFYYYQSGFDPDLTNRSPGSVGVFMAIEDCARRKIQEFDMGQGMQPYKLNWANGERHTAAIEVTRRRLVPQALASLRNAEKRARGAVKQHLRPEMLDRIRAIRERLLSENTFWP